MNKQMVKSERLGYIDCLRGVSMILVVYSHVVMYGLGGDYSELNSFFVTFRMPLFFFISGFVSFKKQSIGNIFEYGKQVRKKLLGQLLPTFFMLGIYVLFHDGDIIEALTSKHHDGYWFTIASFQIYMFYLSVSYTAKSISSKWNDIMLFISIIVMCALGALIARKYGMQDIKGVCAWFSWNYVTYYYFFFMLGVLAKKYIGKLNDALSNKWILLLVFAFACCPITGNQVLNYIVKSARVICIYNIFYFYKDYFGSDSIIPRAFSYIGRHTLEIYFIHFFLLFNIHELLPFLVSKNMFVEFVIISAISMTIICGCLLMRKAIDSIPVLSAMCFGPSKVLQK